LLLATTMAHAALVTWTFQNAGFNDGGQLSGFFKVESVSIPGSTVPIDDFDVKTTAGTTIATPFEYTPANSKGVMFLAPCVSGNCGPFPDIHFGASDFERDLGFGLLGLLTDSGGNFEIDGAAGEIVSASGQSQFRDASGSLYAPPVPEPSSIVLLGIGAGLVLLFRKQLQFI